MVTNVRKQALVSWTLVITWMTVIFSLSAIPDLRSGFQPLWDTILRKGAHVLEYAILAGLSVKAFSQSGVQGWRGIAGGVLLAALYAATDEYHQTFVLGRSGNVVDWVIDASGTVLAGLLMRRWNVANKQPRP